MSIFLTLVVRKTQGFATVTLHRVSVDPFISKKHDIISYGLYS